MKSTAKELALGGMFTALGVVFLCLGGIVPLALYASSAFRPSDCCIRLDSC